MYDETLETQLGVAKRGKISKWVLEFATEMLLGKAGSHVEVEVEHIHRGPPKRKEIKKFQVQRY